MELKQLQRISLSPSHRLIEYMKILQMTSQELLIYLREFAEGNPVIDLDKFNDFERESLNVVIQDLKRESCDEIEAEDERVELPPLYEAAALQQVESLQEHLLLQLPQNMASKEREQICRFLIFSLDDRGFLELTAEEVAAQLQVSEDEVEWCLAFLRQLDPVGVCTANVEKCLILQAQRLNYPFTVIQMLKNHLEDLAKGHYSYISRQLGIPLREVRRNAELIAKLNPVPARGFSSQQETQYIVPDIVVVEDNGLKAELRVTFRNALHVNSYYKQLLRTTDDESVRDYLGKKIYKIEMVKQCIAQRENTLQACADVLLSRQKAWFKGDGPLQPLTVEMIAECVGVDKSTVSRALRGKYIQCRHGSVAVKTLFPAQLSSSSGRVSSNAFAKDMILQFVTQEDKRQPYSDQKLVMLLAENGIQLSRRAVTKYREQMGILASYQRQQ